MDEPIIYCCWLPHPFVKEPAESLSDLLDNALSLDDKDEFLRLLNDPEFEPMQEYHKDQLLFLREYNLERILRENAPQIAMAVINGETKDDVFVNPKLEFKDGWTPLHLACAVPSPKLLKCLIERGDPLDVPCDYYEPLKLKQATPLDLILEVIDAGYESGYYTPKRPWTLCSSIFELFHYVCEWQLFWTGDILHLIANYRSHSLRMNNFAFFTKTAVTAVWSPTSRLKCFCSHPSPLLSPPNSKLFVGGLSWSVDERSLLDAFSTFGDVTEVRILYDKNTGRSRGFGFVNFSKGDDANSAREAMDGKEFLGRPMRIDFALDNVRGAPIVVPRIRDAETASRRN